MTAIVTELFNGTDGVALDTTNTSAGSFTGAGSCAFTTSQKVEGTAGARFITTASLRAAQWLDGSAHSAGYISFYYRPENVPDANTILLYLRASSAGAITGSVQYMTTGQVRINNAAGAIIGTATTDTLVLNEWNRIDLSFNAGTMTVAIYAGNALCNASAGTAAANSTRTGTTTATTYQYRQLGHSTSATLTGTFDAYREDDTALPGPVAAPLATTLTVSPTSGTVPFTVTGTANATGGSGTPKTYAWVWGDGGTTAAGSSNTATHSYTTAGTYTATVTVANS